MKHYIVFTTILFTSFIAGFIVGNHATNKTNLQNTINTRDIISIDSTEEGTLINLIDGTGYYIEK